MDYDSFYICRHARYICHAHGFSRQPDRLDTVTASECAGLIDGGQSSVSGMQSSVLSGAQTAQTITQMVDISLSNINSQLDVLENSIQLLNASGLADADTADISVSVASFDTVEQLAENTLSAIEGLKGVDSSQIEAVRKISKALKHR